MSKQVSRILAWLIAAVIGAVYGTAATIAHAFTAGILPIGLVLATVGTAALLIALRLLAEDRWTALAGGLGMLAATVLFSGIGPGGSAVVAAPTPDTEWIPATWTFVVPILVALVVAWPDVSRLRTGPKLEG
ncbi:MULTISPECIES: histidinol dehydrogenase [unclassified Microbacterium]|uniref:histidinol dehydrogenase n=1 Tax=unclassified Microbacterium TaxID=2609290 RepID=UPI003745B796